MIKGKRALSILAFLLFVSFLVGTASAGTPHYINGTTYPMIWNGTYASENINYMTYWSTGYDMFWNGGLLQTVWENVSGTYYAYDKIAYPNNGTAISPWAMWHIESYNPTNKKWGETIPVSNQFIKIDNSTLKRVMTMGSGEAFNITYHNEGTRIKQDLELSNVLSREYRLTYRIDSVAAQDVSLDTKKFTPGFFNNFTLFDVTDVLPYTVNRTFNETSQLWEGNGSYMYGWNTTASISITDRKMYFTLTNGQVMTAGQTVLIDPSWATNGSTTPAWQNTSLNNIIINHGSGNLELNQLVNNETLYWRGDNSTYNDKNISIYNGTLSNVIYSDGKYGNAFAFNGINSTVSTNLININKPIYSVSVSAFIKRNNILRTDGIFSKGSGWGVTSGFVVFTIGNSLYYGYNGNNGTNSWGSITTPFMNNTYHHVVYTFNVTDKISNLSTQKIYFDGVLETTLNSTLGYITNESNLFKVGFGGNNQYLLGNADDIKYFEYELSLSQVQNLQNQSKYSSGSLLAWHNSTLNETYQITANGSFQTNSNMSTQYAQNGSTPSSFLSPANVTVNTTWGTVPSYLNTDGYFWLFGNGTSTPSVSELTFWTQAVSAGNPPNITSWGNNYTNNNTPSFTVPQNTNVTFNSTANQTLTTCSWTGATQINCSADTFAYKLFDTAGTAYVNLSGSNANGSTLNSVNWTVTISGGEPTVYYRNTTDAITVSDTASRKLSLSRKTADAITVSEDISRKLSATRSTEDLITVSEGAQRVLYAFRAAADAMTISENVNSTYIDVGDVFYRYASDAVSIVEGATRQLTYVRFSEDAIAVAEGAQRTLYAFRNLADTVTVTDSAARKLSLFRSAADSITVIENVVTTYTEAGELFIRYASDTITVTESALSSFWEGVNYIISGYVHNILGVPLENARVEYVEGDHAFSDTTGYYNISVPSGQRDILSRAIGYRNNTETIVITDNTEQNFTLSERTAGTVTTPGFSGIAMIFISVLTLYYIKRNKKYE